MEGNLAKARFLFNVIGNFVPITLKRFARIALLSKLELKAL
jgi:hypothetical protein